MQHAQRSDGLVWVGGSVTLYPFSSWFVWLRRKGSGHHTHTHTHTQSNGDGTICCLVMYRQTDRQTGGREHPLLTCMCVCIYICNHLDITDAAAADRQAQAHLSARVSTLSQVVSSLSSSPPRCCVVRSLSLSLSRQLPSAGLLCCASCPCRLSLVHRQAAQLLHTFVPVQWAGWLDDCGTLAGAFCLSTGWRGV